MACNFLNVGSSAANCKEDYSGLGSYFFLFVPEDLPGGSAANVEYDPSRAEYKKASFEGTKVHCVHIKPKSGKVTYSSNPNGGGFSNVFTATIARDMETYSLISRIMNNRDDWGILVPTAVLGEYYVLYSSQFAIEYSAEGDTGDTPDSDHGHTVTITCSPMQYPMCKVKGANLDIDTYKAERIAYKSAYTGADATDVDPTAGYAGTGDLHLDPQVED